MCALIVPIVNLARRKTKVTLDLDRCGLELHWLILGPRVYGAANTWPQLETQTENRFNRPRGRRKITLYSGSGSIFSKKHTKFCGNSYLNVQNINSSNSDEWTMSLCNAGKSLYLNGAFGL